MAVARWVPIIGLLAVLSFVPGALGHCGFSHGDTSSSNPSQSFSTQSTVAAPSPIAIVGIALIPIGVVGGALALVRGTSSKPVTGRWVATQEQWVWVPDKK